jgi:hypothetical protein
MLTTLQGPRLLLRPLQYSDANALLHAAADGELWNLTVTVVPSASTVDSYLKKALDGRDAGTVMPFVIVLKDNGEVIAAGSNGAGSPGSGNGTGTNGGAMGSGSGGGTGAAGGGTGGAGGGSGS